MAKRKQIFTLLIAISIIIALIVIIIVGFHTPLIKKEYTISSSKIPTEFNDFVIVQLSDFHCNEFGRSEEELINLIRDAHPNIIVLTGDFVDSNPSHDFSNVKTLYAGISLIAPTYYITGNDEYYTNAPFNQMLALLDYYNICYLNNQTIKLNKNGSSILLSGLDDLESKEGLKNQLGYADPNYYNILLYHRSDKFDFVSDYNYDLVLSGHSHGGIVRMPFVGGIFGNENVLFPKYDYGLFQKNNSTMIVSSGLGDSSIPRFNNPYEIVCITLQSEW